MVSRKSVPMFSSTEWECLSWLISLGFIRLLSIMSLLLPTIITLLMKKDDTRKTYSASKPNHITVDFNKVSKPHTAWCDNISAWDAIGEIARLKLFSFNYMCGGWDLQDIHDKTEHAAPALNYLALNPHNLGLIFLIPLVTGADTVPLLFTVLVTLKL